MTDDHDDGAPQLGAGQTTRLVALGALVLVAAGLAFDNRGDVTIGWIVGDRTTPLALALAVTFLLGLAVGWLGRGHRRR